MNILNHSTQCINCPTVYSTVKQANEKGSKSQYTVDLPMNCVHHTELSFKTETEAYIDPHDVSQASGLKVLLRFLNFLLLGKLLDREKRCYFNPSTNKRQSCVNRRKV